MKDQLIEFETAKLAKEKGFEQKHVEEHYLKDENLDTSNMAWENGLSLGSAPTQSLLQRWLREEHKINLLVVEGTHIFEKITYAIDAPYIYEFGTGNKAFKTYEEALEIGLKEALKLI
jgi:hypothetical protein